MMTLVTFNCSNIWRSSMMVPDRFQSYHMLTSHGVMIPMSVCCDSRNTACFLILTIHDESERMFAMPPRRAACILVAAHLCSKAASYPLVQPKINPILSNSIIIHMAEHAEPAKPNCTSFHCPICQHAISSVQLTHGNQCRSGTAAQTCH